MAVPKSKLSHIFILIAMSLLIYSNSFDCSWHFDDDQNIVSQESLHLSKFTLSAIKQIFFSYGADRMYRPVARFTFAVNYYFGGLDVFGYHLVNIFIHILTSVFLYLVMLVLLSINENNQLQVKYKYEIALLASLLWAAHPINVQAVTYIVQRMASIAALFSIVSIYYYLCFRLQKKWRYLAGCIATFVFGVLSKENAVMLLFSLLLIELMFFRDIKLINWIKATAVLIFCFFIVLVIGFRFIDIDFAQLLQYESRLFTPYQRVLTQSRILVYYLYQIFYPNVSNLSVHHDIVISQSVFSPVTTFYSILFIALLVGTAISLLKKFPLYSLAVLFYFLNHIVESSLIGLELMFEHRNYLPSFFLFLPLSSAIFYMLDKYKFRSGLIYYSISIFVLLALVSFGMATYTRNFDWKTETSLWADAIEKAPKSSRPLHNLTWRRYERTGNVDEAIVGYEKALSLKFYDTFQKSTLLANIAFLHHQKGNKRESLMYMEQAVNENSKYTKMKRLLAFMHIRYKEYADADRILCKILAENPKDVESIFLYGKMFYLAGDYEQAVNQFSKILHGKKKFDVINYLCRSYLKLGLYDKSGSILSGTETDLLTHQLLGIITAYYQNDSQKISDLADGLYKKKTAFFMQTIQDNSIYMNLNQEFDGILDHIFKQQHNLQILKLQKWA